MRLTTDLHQALRLRISGAIHVLPLYAFMAWTGTALPCLLQYVSFLSSFLKPFFPASFICTFVSCLSVLPFFLSPRLFTPFSVPFLVVPSFRDFHLLVHAFFLVLSSYFCRLLTVIFLSFLKKALTRTRHTLLQYPEALL